MFLIIYYAYWAQIRRNFLIVYYYNEIHRAHWMLIGRKCGEFSCDILNYNEMHRAHRA